MKPLLLLAAAVLGASAAWAEPIPFESENMAELRRSIQENKDRFAPAAVDPAPVKTLFDRLAAEGDKGVNELGQSVSYLAKTKALDSEGRGSGLTASLIEVPGEEALAEGMQKLVYTRHFSHIAVTSEEWSRGGRGEQRVEIWRYTLSLDGRLLTATRENRLLDANFARGKGAAAPSQPAVERMNPGDKKVQARWKELTPELLKLRKTYSI